MATISSSIRMMDRLTGPVITMANAMGHLVAEMEAADNKNINPGMEQLKANVARANAEMRMLKEELTQSGGKTEQNTAKQQQWNSAIGRGKNEMNGLLGKLKTALGLYALMNMGKKLIGLSDEKVTIDARLNLITDTAAQKNNLKNAIYQSAQDARVPLNEFASSVAKLGQLAGSKFANNGEIVKFNNLMAKSFKLSGASAQETAAAMYQLNQAMASGRLQGDEFRSIRENAPMLAQAIAKTMNVSMAELKKLGAEGKITADVIKNALFNAGDEIEKQYKSLPLTWRDVWIRAGNFAIRALDPLLRAINRVANSQKFQAMASSIASSFEIVAGVMTKVFEIALTLAGQVYDKWDLIKPIVIAVAVAMGAYAVALGIANVAVGIYNIAQGFKAAADMAAAGASFMATTAQYGLNAAVWAFPGTWIVAIVVAIIVAIIALVAAIIYLIKYFTKTATVTGAVVGAFAWMAAMIWNVYADIINGTVWLVNTIIGKLNALISGTAKGLSSFANLFIDAFNWIMRKADEFMNGLLQKLSLAGPLLSAVGIKLPTSTGGALQLSKINLSGPQIGLLNGGKNEVLRKKDTNAAYDKWSKKGNEWQKGAGDWLKGGMEDVKSQVLDLFDPNDLGGGKGFDPAGGKDPNGVGKNTGKTADNTGKMADKLEDTEEEMKYLRELAEQEHINQFTTAEIKVDMNNTNNIEKDADIDDVIRKLTEKIEEKMRITAAGVY